MLWHLNHPLLKHQTYQCQFSLLQLWTQRHWLPIRREPDGTEASIKQEDMFEWRPTLQVLHLLLNSLCYDSFHNTMQTQESQRISKKTGFPGGLDSKASACNARDLDSIPGSGRSPGEGNSNPLQYSCLENPWTQEHSRLQSMGSRRIRHDWATSHGHGQEYLCCFPNTGSAHIM